MRYLIACVLAAVSLVAFASGAAAHIHHEDNPSHIQPLANGQNHPGFSAPSGGVAVSCDGVLEPANAGPAGYGLETAHHGPDAGDPGKDDGCYAVVGNPVDGNPAIN